MGVAGAIGIGMTSGYAGIMSLLGTAPYRTAANFLLITVSMFILMAEIISASGIVRDLFNVAAKWVGRLPEDWR